MELTDAIYSKETDTIKRRSEIIKALHDLGIQDAPYQFEDTLNRYRKQYGSFAELNDNYDDYMIWRDRVVALDIAKYNNINPIYTGLR